MFMWKKATLKPLLLAGSLPLSVDVSQLETLRCQRKAHGRFLASLIEFLRACVCEMSQPAGPVLPSPLKISRYNAPFHTLAGWCHTLFASPFDPIQLCKGQIDEYYNTFRSHRNTRSTVCGYNQRMVYLRTLYSRSQLNPKRLRFCFIPNMWWIQVSVTSLLCDGFQSILPTNPTEGGYKSITKKVEKDIQRSRTLYSFKIQSINSPLGFRVNEPVL